MRKSIYSRIHLLVQKNKCRNNFFSVKEDKKNIFTDNFNKRENFDFNLCKKENFLQKNLLLVSKTKRAIPNIMLRSSLFGIVKKGNRKYERNILKTTLNGLFIRFTGESLDQSDLDVWLECLHRLTKVPLGEKVMFSTHDFLKAIGRTTGKRDYEWLTSCLIRLSICSIEISYKNCFYMGHLLHEWYKNIKNKKHIIVLNKKIISFFTDSMWTGISLKERRKLKGKFLSQWVHCFYCSHNDPLCYKVSTLQKLCGSKIKMLWKFRQNLKKSLYEVAFATGWECWIDINDIVHVKKLK
ncbi:hypothetical protein GJT88_02320 (plasmid) [Enterobacteriaceae endosymbiont of Donacia tomentosa]|uniref:plasmid replication initiator TrfA n=1 Tax=Enterobacteriaceae endosymbiont of Donacia tomentosa TaxID=2675787 RepID=UPI001448ACD7|nr:plasmid replication initiator TrfA [Enterobacteriaceae endosymbiont of Donacia tomentosa]QJC31890.1 hypothetical protein GJT88_02320 [Enterobacteriaceae endosymbiont of Donacia tomentosa]